MAKKYKCKFCEEKFKPDKNFISHKLSKLYKERDKYIEYSDNDRKEGLIPWGCEIAIIQIEDEIKELEKLLSDEISS